MTLAALVLSLPARDSTLRMRVWRALKEHGCAVLRDGVYVLPAAVGRKALPPIEAEIRAAGGFAMTVELRLRGAAQRSHVRRLFDRSAAYGALLAELNAAGAPLPRLQRAYDRLAAIDFFPGRAKRQAAEALKRLSHAKDEPRRSRKGLRPRDPARYRGRLWATRRGPWIDRLASAWLIKRFIDREARFAWIGQPRERPKRAVGFDFDGAEFTHVRDRVTFEVLLASFGLERDPALARIAAAVHYLDIGGVPVADAQGLETVMRGIKEKARGDDALLAAALRIFDHFYAAYSQVDKP